MLYPPSSLWIGMKKRNNSSLGVQGGHEGNGCIHDARDYVLVVEVFYQAPVQLPIVY